MKLRELPQRDPAALFNGYLKGQIDRHKWFLDFDAKAADYEQRIEARMDDETKKAKAYKAGKFTLVELGTYFLSTSSDMTAANIAKKGGVKFSSFMSDWGKKLDQGMSLLGALGIL